MRLLLADVAKLIDDLHYDNFNVPALMHQERVLRDTARATRPVGYVPAEEDYVDARPKQEYCEPDFTLREIQSNEEFQKLTAAIQAFQTALRGKKIPIKLLRRALTQHQLQLLEARCEEVVEPAEYLYGDGMPEPLREYNKKLQRADFAWWRYEAAPTSLQRGSKRNTAKLGELENNAISLYEDALEHLEETFACARRGDWGVDMEDQLRRWLDREIDFDVGAGRTIDADVNAIPRVRGSKSRYALDSGLPKLSKRTKRQLCALSTLLEAATEIAFEIPRHQASELTDAETAMLKAKLALLK